MRKYLLIPDFGGNYRVSNKGIVQSRKKRRGNKWMITKRWKTMRPRITGKSEHHRIVIHHKGVRKEFFIHHLVLMLFGPPKPFPKALGLHKDDNPYNNAINNLYWGTSKQNRADAMRSGRAYIPKGEENGRSILTAAQAAAIKAFPRKRGYRIILAKKFGVSVDVIKGVSSGRTWAAVPCDSPAPQTYGTGKYTGRKRR